MTDEKSVKTKSHINVKGVIFGCLLIVAVMLLTDPDNGIITNLPFGSTTVTYLVYLSTGILGVGLLYLSERAMFYHIDYLEIVEIAKGTPVGAGLFLLAISLQSLAFAVALVAILN